MEKFARVASINAQIRESPDRLIEMAENNYSAYISEAADIISRDDRHVILLSGPSGSGKTTTALRITRTMRERGISTHTLSMDNYFLPITPENEKTLPRSNDGKIDLESPLRLDIPLFSEHLKMLIEGEPFDMPLFDFTTQSRASFAPVRRRRDEIIIIEGIHALNPQVTGRAGDPAFKIYVSVGTGLRSEDGTLLRPRQIRLMRRLCRDRLFRKRSFREIFGMFDSVSRGENMYIFPYKYRADYNIDTFMAYEPSVYKGILQSELTAQNIEECLDSFADCGEIMKFLNELSLTDTALVPPASLIREFIGGSELDY